MEKRLTEEELQEFYAKATEHFQAVDTLIQVVLRGHLLLEDRLNATLKHSLYNPELFEKMNLNFHHKLLFARSFSISLRAEGVWDLIAAIKYAEKFDSPLARRGTAPEEVRCGQNDLPARAGRSGASSRGSR